MTKYRKKPVVVEAWKWNASHSLLNELVDNGMRWVSHSGHKSDDDLCTNLRISTLEGPLNVSLGDYIIRGIKGEFYPCKPDIFEATYERVAGEQ